MEFKQYYSSSKGNLYTVKAANGERILIECGIRWDKLQKTLDYDLTGIIGCLISHEHQDHCKAVNDILKAGIDVYASPGTAEALKIQKNRRVHKYEANIIGKSFETFRYPANHDAAEPSLFVIHNKPADEWLLYAIDTSHIIQRFTFKFNIIAIECAYDYDSLLKRVSSGEINESLAKRLLSSHMEKKNVMRYLTEFCDLSRCNEIHLLHMSGGNIDKEQTRKEFEQKLFIKTIIR